MRPQFSDVDLDRLIDILKAKSPETIDEILEMRRGLPDIDEHASMRTSRAVIAAARDMSQFSSYIEEDKLGGAYIYIDTVGRIFSKTLR